MKRFLLMGLALLPAMAFAQGFQVNLNGQKQIGMGNTGTGILSDGAAVMFNPGAVAQLPQNSVQAGSSPLVFKTAFMTTGSNQQFDNLNELATPFNAYVVLGAKNSPWKFAMGVYTPFGGLTNWGPNWEGKYSLISLDLRAIYFQPTVSYKLTDKVSIGAGVVYNRASVDLVKAIPLSGLAGQDGQAELKGAGHGWGYNAGIFVKASDKLSLGLSYRSQVNTTISGGDAVFTVPTSVQSAFPAGNQFTASIPLPSTTSLGIGYSPCSKWLIGADFNYVHWSSYTDLTFNYTKAVNGSYVTSSPRNYQDAYDYRLGAQYTLNQVVAFRFGGGYATTAVKDGYVTPEAPDANRVYGTIGLGYKPDKNMDIDISLMCENLMSRTQTNIETQLSGTFKTLVYIPGISLSYHW